MHSILRNLHPENIRSTILINRELNLVYSLSISKFISFNIISCQDTFIYYKRDIFFIELKDN